MIRCTITIKKEGGNILSNSHNVIAILFSRAPSSSVMGVVRYISHGCCQVAKDSSCPLSHWHHRAPEGLSYPRWHSIHIDKLISPCRRSITLSPTLFGFSPLMYLYMEKTCIPRPKIFLRIHIMQLWETKP